MLKNILAYMWITLMDYIDMEIMWKRQRRAKKIGREWMGGKGKMGENDGNGGGQEVQEGHRG